MPTDFQMPLLLVLADIGMIFDAEWRTAGCSAQRSSRDISASRIGLKKETAQLAGDQRSRQEHHGGTDGDFCIASI